MQNKYLERFDRERRIAVEADLALGQTIGTALSQINGLPIMQNLPDGVVMVLLVLVLLFKDFLQPVTILTALPLSIGGTAVGLLAYCVALDMSSVIGILMLMDIVTKNSILLVDFVIEKRQQGMHNIKPLFNQDRNVYARF
ncbi:efflux RND transporter permease subunit [Pasteurella multocida]|nr:efflux RND transporter permease subunit [Pasteurella multocida]MDY0655143.1 efflux RND transporter permease subunit [Pasteurella multocida]MEB3476506.1 efflux RND transporter permease subunit [Pasteurella multocida]MEB3506494.1 efflux RND transporter permease subunit [Pasteurella multocida]WRJ98210.1 efflux RND transporter permease subunit [Pasteurella multocida]WRU39529.1 efflux RND transporter permease subunit [Pasteurella multocida]